MRFARVEVYVAVVVPLVLSAILTGSLRVYAQSERTTGGIQPAHCVVILIDNSRSLAAPGLGIIAQQNMQAATALVRFLLKYARSFLADDVAIGANFFGYTTTTQAFPIQMAGRWSEGDIDNMKAFSCSDEGQQQDDPCYGTKRIDAMNWAVQQISSCPARYGVGRSQILLLTDSVFETDNRVDTVAATRRYLASEISIPVLPILLSPNADSSVWDGWADEGIVARPVSMPDYLDSDNAGQLYLNVLDQLQWVTPGTTVQILLGKDQDYSRAVNDGMLFDLTPDLYTITLDTVVSTGITLSLTGNPTRQTDARYQWNPPFSSSIAISAEGKGIVAYRFTTETVQLNAQFGVEPSTDEDPLTYVITASIAALGRTIPPEWLEVDIGVINHEDTSVLPFRQQIGFDETDKLWRGEIDFRRAGNYTLTLELRPIPPWQPDIPPFAPLVVSVKDESWEYEIQLEPLIPRAREPVTIALLARHESVITDAREVSKVVVEVTNLDEQPPVSDRYQLEQISSSWQRVVSLVAGNYRIQGEIHEKDGSINDTSAVYFAVPTATDTPVPTATDTPVPTATDTPVPTATDTPVPTATDTPVPTATDTPVPTATDTPVPTATDTPVPTVFTALPGTDNSSALSVTTELHESLFEFVLLIHVTGFTPGANVDLTITDIGPPAKVLMDESIGIPQKAAVSLVYKRPWLRQAQLLAVARDSLSREKKGEYTTTVNGWFSPVAVLLFASALISLSYYAHRKVVGNASESNKKLQESENKLSEEVKRLEKWKPNDEILSQSTNFTDKPKEIEKLLASLTDHNPYSEEILTKMGTSLALHLDKMSMEQFESDPVIRELIRLAHKHQPGALEVLVFALLKCSVSQEERYKEKQNNPDWKQCIAASPVAVIYNPDLSAALLRYPTVITKVVQWDALKDSKLKDLWSKWGNWAKKTVNIRNLNFAEIFSPIGENKRGLDQLDDLLTDVHDWLTKQCNSDFPQKQQLCQLMHFYADLKTLLRSARCECASVNSPNTYPPDEIPAACKQLITQFKNSNTFEQMANYLRKIEDNGGSNEAYILQTIVLRIGLLEG